VALFAPCDVIKEFPLRSFRPWKGAVISGVVRETVESGEGGEINGERE